MTKARDIADFKFENIVDTGTEGTKVASGTTAQRGSTTGQIRFNSTTGLAEYYDGTQFKPIDSPPTISSIDVTEVDSQAGGNQTVVITGGNFASGATVTFVGNSGTDFNASTVTVDSVSQITAVAPKSSFLNAQEPYGVKVENISGLSATLASQINVDSSPSWQTASGTIATIDDNDTGTHATVSATDPDGDTVSYSETTSVLSGAGLSLNSSTGAISGDPTDVSASTTNTFTLRATANSKTADRQFSIIVNPFLDGTSQSRANTSASAILSVNPSSTNGWYWIKPSGYTGSAFQVYCDFTTASGGWHHVATIQDNSSDLSNTSNNPWSFGLHRTAISSGSITHDNNATGYWGSTSTLNSGSTGSGTTAFGQDYKDTAYNEIPFTKILMKDQGSSFRNLWYTTNDVPNASTYATSAQNWFATGGRSGNVWQSSSENRNDSSINALRLNVTNFSNNDDVFGSSISAVIFFFGEPSGTDSGNQDRSMITPSGVADSVSTTQGLGVSRATDFSSQVFRDIDPTYADEPTSNSTNYSYTLWVR